MHWSGLRPSSSLGSDHQMMESRVLGCLLEHTQLGSCVWGTGPCVSVFIHPFCWASPSPVTVAKGGELIGTDLG